MSRNAIMLRPEHNFSASAAVRVIALALVSALFFFAVLSDAEAAQTAATKKCVVIVPVDGDIEPALAYIIRRGVKEASRRNADALVLHMNTDGGRLDTATDIINIVRKFEKKGQTYTLVESKAFSAGAFIAAATKYIYMTPGSVIGAATPILMTGQEMPKSTEEKMTSAVRGLVRAAAEEQGHNTAVFEAMIDKDQGLNLNGIEIMPKGKILTLTSKEAETSYGKPPKPLLSAGTVASMDEMLARAGLAQAEIVKIEETGFERLARWIVKISPILMLAGIVGIYVEFKTPGFGLPGIFGGVCLLFFFFGHYIAGFSGHEAAMLFVLGVGLVLLELLFFPGTIVLGLSGFALVIVSLLMAMVDHYPSDPAIPSMPQLQLPIMNLSLAVAGSVVVIGLMARILPESKLFQSLVLQEAVRDGIPATLSRTGEIGVADSPLRPSGRAIFGERLEDVMTDNEFIEKGEGVKIISVEGTKITVEKV